MNIARPEQNRSSQFLSDPNASSPPRTLARAAVPPQFQANPARLPLNFQTTFQDQAFISSPAIMITGSGQALSSRRLWDRTTSIDIPGSLDPTRWPFGVKKSPLLSSFRPSALAPGRSPSQEQFEGHLPLLLLRSRIPPSPSGRFCSGVGDGQTEPLRVDSAERLACDQEGIPD